MECGGAKTLIDFQRYNFMYICILVQEPSNHRHKWKSSKIDILGVQVYLIANSMDSNNAKKNSVNSIVMWIFFPRKDYSNVELNINDI